MKIPLPAIRPLPPAGRAARLCGDHSGCGGKGQKLCERRDGGAMARSEVKSEIGGRVWKLEARVGDRLAADDAILILESMKMEIPVPAPAAGRIFEIRVAETDVVEEGQVVAVMETEDRRRTTEDR
jgi:acetyl-CoA carboxylase biotin carboxyl carrier protein